MTWLLVFLAMGGLIFLLPLMVAAVWPALVLAAGLCVACCTWRTR